MKIFSGLISTTSSVVFITVRIASVFFSSTAVHIYIYMIFIYLLKISHVFTWDACRLKVYS